MIHHCNLCLYSLDELKGRYTRNSPEPLQPLNLLKTGPESLLPVSLNSINKADQSPER